MKVPETIRKEHEELHGQLAAATREPGRVGEAARVVAKIMHPHFLREDEYAMPPLLLLKPLSQGRFDPAMAEILPQVERLRSEMPLMLEEHKAIVGALNELEQVAIAEGRPGIAVFAAELKLHAAHEEEILYPAALLVGEIVKAKLPQPVRV
jgi:hypothetical protein